jgi:alpha-amylase
VKEFSKLPVRQSNRIRVLVLTLLLFASAGCRENEPTASPVAPSTKTAVPAPPVATDSPGGLSGQYWWNDAVFYQIFVRSFRDSDDDGTGDLNGLIEKLDYLNDGDPNTSGDLGVTGIWLMPIAQSPSYHGYDVVDYLTVERDYGTNEDFQRLVEEAHKRGIKVLVDLVLNHTSNQHPWFEEARSGEDSPYRDYYVWSEDDPGYNSPWGSRAWHRLPSGYYYGVFWEGMPDLNYTNPEVTAEMREVTRFWLEDMGVDGFRLDGAKHLIEDGPQQEHTPATHEWLSDFRTFYKDVNPEAVTVGEIWSPTRDVVPYVGGELDLAFEFDTAGAMLNSAKYEDSSPILRAHRFITERYPFNQFATFLTNHDQARVMTELAGNVDHARSAASLLLTGPGVPFIYYGEEVGQIGGKPDENIRTPMQWNGGENAGFTDGATSWQPPQSNYQEVNVAAQSDDADSLLSHYRRLIQARSEHEAVRAGAWREVETDERRIYTSLRQSGDDIVLVVVNLSGEPISDYALFVDDGPLSTGVASEILTGVPVEPPALNANGGFDDYRPLDELAPYSIYLIQLY